MTFRTFGICEYCVVVSMQRLFAFNRRQLHAGLSAEVLPHQIDRYQNDIVLLNKWIDGAGAMKSFHLMSNEHSFVINHTFESK